MSEYAIKTLNLTKRFGEQVGVDCVNMNVPRGKIYGLLGRNGAGKTTTMRMLLNLASPTSGQILLFGEDCQKNQRGIYHRIGSMIETPGFYENLTARENLQIFARLRAQKKKDSVQNVLEIVGLEKETKKAFGNYSLGMKQRLGIAAAIMHEPEMLILDEPINGLDPVGIQEVRKYLEVLCREKGVAILISSHILNEIEQIADTIGVMHEGRLIEEVSMQELRERNRRYVEFAVSDNNKASFLLEDKFAVRDYCIHENRNIRIYGRFELRSEFNRCFVENGISVWKINASEEKLEDYFSNLIGGGGLG